MRVEFSHSFDINVPYVWLSASVVPFAYNHVCWLIIKYFPIFFLHSSAIFTYRSFVIYSLNLWLFLKCHCLNKKLDLNIFPKLHIRSTQVFNGVFSFSFSISRAMIIEYHNYISVLTVSNSYDICRNLINSKLIWYCV